MLHKNKNEEKWPSKRVQIVINHILCHIGNINKAEAPFLAINTKKIRSEFFEIGAKQPKIWAKFGIFGRMPG